MLGVGLEVFSCALTSYELNVKESEAGAVPAVPVGEGGLPEPPVIVMGNAVIVVTNGLPRSVGVTVMVKSDAIVVVMCVVRVVVSWGPVG